MMGKRKREDTEEGGEEGGEGENTRESKQVKIDSQEEQPSSALGTATNRRAPQQQTKSYDELVELASVIAKPMAGRKLTKRLYKTVRKAKKAKKLRRGVREVVKALRKNEKGVVILAGDVSPIDVISHIPVFCEEKEVPYCYVPSRKDLGLAGGTQRPTSVVLVQSGKDYEEIYQDCHGLVSGLPLPLM